MLIIKPKVMPSAKIITRAITPTIGWSAHGEELSCGWWLVVIDFEVVQWFVVRF